MSSSAAGESKVDQTIKVTRSTGASQRSPFKISVQ